MADFFGTTEAALNRWKHEHPEFRASIARGKISADANVAERMYQRALGYSHEAVKIFMPAGATEPVYAPYTEHYPPDTPAASLWLRNRQSGKWRDKVDHEVTVRKDARDFTEEELAAIVDNAHTGGDGASSEEAGSPVNSSLH